MNTPRQATGYQLRNIRFLFRSKLRGIQPKITEYFEEQAPVKLKRFIPLPVRTGIRRFLLDRIKVASPRVRISNKYIRGRGIEIGALQNPLWVSAHASVRYVDRMPADQLLVHYQEFVAGGLLEPDIIDDGERLETLADAGQDFVIANHFIEHMENPILALSNMMRVLKERGILYMAIPDKRYTFDAERPSTPFEHLLRDYREGPEWSRRAHFEEWVRYTDKITEEPALSRKVESVMALGYSIHYHVWKVDEMLDMFKRVKEVLPYAFKTELYRENNEEVIFVLRKTGPAQQPD